jgi:hypothetical protein
MKLDIINVIVCNYDPACGHEMLRVFTIPFNYKILFTCFLFWFAKKIQHVCLIQIWNHEKQEHNGEDVYSQRQEQIWYEFPKIKLYILLKPQSYKLKFEKKKKHKNPSSSLNPPIYT